jgi:leucyl aminopeptidase
VAREIHSRQRQLREQIAQLAARLIAEDGIDVEVWGPRELQKRGFGGLLAVGLWLGGA